MRFVLLASLGLCSTAALPACGSSVTTGTGGNNTGGGSDDATSGPASGSGASSGVTSASGTATASTGAGGAGGAALCDQVCDHLATLGCAEPSCLEECTQSYAATPQCVAQLDAAAKCVAVASSCELVECSAQLDSYFACTNGGACGATECGGTGSSGGQTFCTCSATCNGVEVTTDCTSFGGGDAKCECYINGMVVGACAEPIRLQCEVEGSCCSQFF